MNLSRQILELEWFAFLPNEDDAAVLALNAGQLVTSRHPNLLNLFLQQVLNSRGALGQIRVLLVAEYEKRRAGNTGQSGRRTLMLTKLPTCF